MHSLNSHLLYLMMSHSYAIVVIRIKIIYYSYDAGFLFFLAHIWMRIVGWIHGWLFKVTLLETWWWWVLTYMMIGCFICWLMQIFPNDDTWFMQIWMAMVFLTYDRMWMILYIENSIQKDELMQTYLVIGWWLIHYWTYTGCWSRCC